MNNLDEWIDEIYDSIPSNETSKYGNSKHHIVANYYRYQLDLPMLRTKEEADIFIEEIFRIPFQELVKIPELLGHN